MAAAQKDRWQGWREAIPGFVGALIPVLLAVAAVAFFRTDSDRAFKNQYPYRVTRTFEIACLKQDRSTARYCTCLITRAQASVPFETFEAEASAILVGQSQSNVKKSLAPCDKKKKPVRH